MEWMSLNTLREKYLAFYETKDHLRLESFSLVPNNDKSLLLINSGMAPMKKFFTGEVTPPRKGLPPAKNVFVLPILKVLVKPLVTVHFLKCLETFPSATTSSTKPPLGLGSFVPRF